MPGARVAIIDSGVNPAHPHLEGSIAGGVHILAHGESDVYLDYLGHGTAVAAAIHEKAPGAELYAVKVFDRSLSTDIEILLRALEWALDRDMHVINLSLGTGNPAHRPRFEPLIARAGERGVAMVCARDSLPGSLPGVIGVRVDWECPRDGCRSEAGVFFASGYPRPIPGVPPERNLHGVSFAVANMTGLVAREGPGAFTRAPA